MLSFEGGTLLLKETVTMLKSRDVIYRGPASFLCMIHVPVSSNYSCTKEKDITFFFIHPHII